jgi:hypothetical protein
MKYLKLIFDFSSLTAEYENIKTASSTPKKTVASSGEAYRRCLFQV